MHGLVRRQTGQQAQPDVKGESADAILTARHSRLRHSVEQAAGRGIEEMMSEMRQPEVDERRKPIELRSLTTSHHLGIDDGQEIRPPAVAARTGRCTGTTEGARRLRHSLTDSPAAAEGVTIEQDAVAEKRRCRWRASRAGWGGVRRPVLLLANLMSFSPSSTSKK